MNQEKLKKMLYLGESHDVEYKVKLQAHSFGREFCAFLNSRGGYIVFGIDSNGVMIGIDPKYNMHDLERIIYQDISPKALFSFNINEIEGVSILVIEVPAGKDIPYAYKNEIYVREDSNTTKADINTIRDMVMRRQIEPERWERRFSSAEIESDLSITEINSTIKILNSSPMIKLRNLDNNIMILEDLSILKYGRLTNAGDVLFTVNPTSRYPQIRVKAVCFTSDKSDSTYQDMKSFEGPLVQVLDEVYGFILRNIPQKARFMESSLERIDEPLYPSFAIREGLVKEIVA